MRKVLPTWCKDLSSNELNIDGQIINPLGRPCIIAEIGVNHNGLIDDAKKLADLAAENGADIVKTQIHIAKSEMSENAKLIKPQHCNKDIYTVIDNLSLTLDEEHELYEHIKANGTGYLSTPFSHDAAEFLKELGVTSFKIGSGEFNNLPLIDRILEVKDVSILASTGMQTLDTVKKVYNHMKEKTSNIVLMHTTNIYPTPNSLVRLEGIREIMEECKTMNVGLSDHTTSNHAAYGAMALGAVVIERHFTDTKERLGPDIENSMEPKELKELRKAADIYRELRWGSKLKLIKEEDDTRNFAFASVVSKTHIKKGETLTKENITTKRPGDGEIPAIEMNSLIGKKAYKNIGENIQLRRKDVCK